MRNNKRAPCQRAECPVCLLVLCGESTVTKHQQQGFITQRGGGCYSTAASSYKHNFHQHNAPPLAVFTHINPHIYIYTPIYLYIYVSFVNVDFKTELH